MFGFLEREHFGSRGGAMRTSVFRDVDLYCQTNNSDHHTLEISERQLTVRRGQQFQLGVKLNESFNPSVHPLTITAVTGKYPSEVLGTMCQFGIPDTSERSSSAKALWKVQLDKCSSPQTGQLCLIVTPPADAPVGQYKLLAKYRNEEYLLTVLGLLFNPWCSDDTVFLPDEAERQEYVMNEQGIIYTGGGNYIFPMNWDFGQFEAEMVKICMALLDVSNKQLSDPANDASARSDPVYVSRVVSAMINSADDRGVLMGRWGNDFYGGFAPTHWNNSYTILKHWYYSNYSPVKYGQCWVFAAVMCSVMRLLGIPCRVVTNYQSAHDTNGNLTIDTYYGDYGVRVKESRDSIWNFHVWVEGWMRRPDLTTDGRYDGWQVLDPTPQEVSDGVYCCGPAPVAAILRGDTNVKYDIPFVFAEVNADCVFWLVKANGSMQKIHSDTMKVGQNVSTKAVGMNKRMNITHLYKYREGTQEERDAVKNALDRKENGWMNNGVNGSANGRPTPRIMTFSHEAITTNGDEVPHIPPVTILFEELSKPVNGEDVKMKLVMKSDSKEDQQLNVNISVQAMKHQGSPAGNIQKEENSHTLTPGKDLSIPIVIPFSAYQKHMLQSEYMKVTALVTDKEKPENVYLSERNIVLKDPPLSVKVSDMARINTVSTAEVVFENPLNEILRDCTLTVSGSGIFRKEVLCRLPDLLVDQRIRVQISFIPYREGERFLMFDFDCSAFKDIKASCSVNVKA